MTTVEAAACDELSETRQRLRDLVAISTLYSLWLGRDAVGVAEAFAGAAMSLLDLDVICLQFQRSLDSTVTRVIRGRRSLAPDELSRLDAALAPWLNEATLPAGDCIADPVGGGQLRVVRNLLGLTGEDGTVLAGARRTAFPSDFERLLLSLGSKQVAAALKERRVLAESERRFQIRADTAPVMLWTAGRDGLFDWFNRLWLEFTGRPMEQERGNGWMDGLHPEDHARCLAMQVDAQAHRLPFESEYRLRRCDGEYRWIFSRGVPRFDSDGSSFEGYVGWAIDVTERMAAAQEMRNFVSLAGQSADFVAMAGLDGGTLFLNAAGQRLVGLASDDEARQTGILDFFFPEDHSAAREVLQSVLRDGQWVGELRFRNFRTQGSIPVGCNVFLLCDEVGRPARFATVTRDLTEQKRTEEYLRHQDRMKDEFLATVSHELRTPLNAIVGWAQILRAAKTEAEMREKGVEVIVRSARALNQLVSDLLDVSRIIAGKLALEVRPLSVLSVLEEALDMVRPAAQAKDIALNLTVRSEPPDFSGDPDRLQQIVWNLLSNAIKFVPRGGHIHVGLQAAGPDVEITIEDDGPGINPGVLPHIFERFRQEDSSNTRRLGGLGPGPGHRATSGRAARRDRGRREPAGPTGGGLHRDPAPARHVPLSSTSSRSVNPSRHLSE